MTQQAESSTDKSEPVWGRVLLCGGTDWANLGKAKKQGAPPPSEDHPDLPHAHILRSLANVKAVSVHTSHSGCHAVVIDVYGTAYLFGRNTSSCLGVSVAALPVISEQDPRKLRPVHLGASEKSKFVYAACGRGHTLLIDDNGDVWSAGLNVLGQCGHSPRPEITSFKRINGPWSRGAAPDKVISASAGITFSLVLTESGKVYSFGSAEYGQLGNGRTGEHIATGNKSAFDIEWDPIRIKTLDDKKIVQISCGQQHSIALDEDGYVYVWGTGGYCRTGLGIPKDQLIPVQVPKFTTDTASMRGEKVVAGVTCSVVIDRQGMYWLAGKWKISGDGSGGQPYSSFRLLQDIMSCRMLGATCGGVTQFAFCPSDDNGGIMTVGWGQNANNSELGLGEGAPKSATKPLEIEALKGLNIFHVAAGQHTSYFIAKPNDNLSEMDRYPEIESVDECATCHTEKEDADLLECEKCETAYHLSCLDPPLSAVPDGEWFCSTCTAGADSSSIPAPIDPPPVASSQSKDSAKKRGRPAKANNGEENVGYSARVEYDDDLEDEDDDEDDNDDDDDRPSKKSRKGGAKRGAKAPARKRK